MSGFFVTATGTDIGKTFVTAGLVRLLRSRGIAVSALKPVLSGFSPDRAADSDAGVLLAALGEAVTPDRLDAISPWRFAAPLSPDMAAAREGRSLGFDELVAFCRERIAGAMGTVFVEGVGGVMVPLDERHTVRDWMMALGLPLVLVGGSYLGALSHTLTALEAITAAGLNVAALVVNETDDSSVPLGDCVASLQRFVGGVPITALSRQRSSRDTANEFADLWRTLDSWS